MMEKARTIQVCFLRSDRGRDWKVLEACRLSDARALVIFALQNASGLYTEADICIENSYTETIPRATAVSALVPSDAQPELIGRATAPGR